MSAGLVAGLTVGGTLYVGFLLRAGAHSKRKLAGPAVPLRPASAPLSVHDRRLLETAKLEIDYYGSIQSPSVQDAVDRLPPPAKPPAPAARKQPQAAQRAVRPITASRQQLPCNRGDFIGSGFVLVVILLVAMVVSFWPWLVWHGVNSAGNYTWTGATWAGEACWLAFIALAAGIPVMITTRKNSARYAGTEGSA